jgi:hypothetical protein
MSVEFPAHALLNEPRLLFHPVRDETHLHPLQGLIEFGPYSRSLLKSVIDPIRVAVVAPHGEIAAVRRLVAELEQVHQPKERRAYLVPFPGFTRVFRVKVALATEAALVELPPKFDEDIKASAAPYVFLAEALSRVLRDLSAIRHEFDVVAIYLPNRWSSGFYGGEDSDFDLHHYLKAVMAARSLPTQILREDSALRYFCRCSVAWRLSIALYCKSGGIPWKMANAEPDTAYVGLSYAMREHAQTHRYVTCCSQVFDAEGSGLEFVAYETDDVRVERDNPFLSRNEMRRVMTRTLSLYQRRHSGSAPRRIVVHKSTEFKHDEIEGCFEALTACESIDLIQVQQDVAWRGVLINQPRLFGLRKGEPSGYPINRGTAVLLDGRSVLLWTQGNAPAAVGGKDFYKEGKGIPMPLLLHRFAGHGPWAPGCSAVLGLTKMNWNNDSLYDRLPVTMAYAQVLAQVVKRMPELRPQTYQFRFFM